MNPTERKMAAAILRFEDSRVTGPDSLRSAGVKIGRYSARNYAKVDSWETIYGKGNLAPGDLLFYKSSGTSDTTITHVGIWLGSNKLVHASSSRSSVVVTSWSTWSDENFLFAKRVF